MHVAEAKILADPGLSKLAETDAGMEIVSAPTGI